MDGLPRLKHQSELRRLLRYLRPYTPLLAGGVFLMMAMGAIEFLTAFSIRPALDVVLNPQSTAQKLTLFQIPWNGHTVYLNSFVPDRIRHVWSVFALALVSLFLVKGLAEFFGGSLIEYVGLSSITDLRNQVYAKLVQQPVGFFHHNPVGRVMSAVISDVEQLRAVFSDYLVDFFRQIFSLVAFICVLLVVDWRMAIGAAVLIPLVLYPVARFGRRIRHSSQQSRSRLADLSPILQETISGNRVGKAFGVGGFRERKFREASRKLLRENMCWVRAFLMTSPLMDVLGAVVLCMILLYRRDEIKVGRLTIGFFWRVHICAFQSL